MQRACVVHIQEAIKGSSFAELDRYIALRQRTLARMGPDVPSECDANSMFMARIEQAIAEQCDAFTLQSYQNGVIPYVDLMLASLRGMALSDILARSKRRFPDGRVIKVLSHDGRTLFRWPDRGTLQHQAIDTITPFQRAVSGPQEGDLAPENDSWYGGILKLLNKTGS